MYPKECARITSHLKKPNIHTIATLFFRIQIRGLSIPHSVLSLSVGVRGKTKKKKYKVGNLKWSFLIPTGKYTVYSVQRLKRNAT